MGTKESAKPWIRGSGISVLTPDLGLGTDKELLRLCSDSESET